MAAIPIALPIVWLAALVLFAVAEAATVSLVSIWFAGGALIAFLVLSLIHIWRPSAS